MVVLEILHAALAVATLVLAAALWRLGTLISRAAAAPGPAPADGPPSGAPVPLPTPFPRRFVVRRYADDGSVEAEWAEDARGAAARVLRERKAGKTGDLRIDGKVVRRWEAGRNA